MTLQAGIASRRIEAAWPDAPPCRDELATQAIVLREDGGPLAALVTADVCLLWPEIAMAIRARVADAIGTAPDRVGIFCTQNHGTPFVGRDGLTDIAHLTAQMVAAALAAADRVQPVEVAYAEALPTPAIQINRRKILDGFGALTYWYGHDALADGTAGCAALLRHTLDGLAAGDEVTRKCPGAPVDGPAEDLAIPDDSRMDGPADGLIQGLFFRTLAGVPVGALARFACHPAAATGLAANRGGDYPVYVRRTLAAAFGGDAIFLTGPCGDHAAIVPQKSIDLARQVGQRVADELLAALPTAAWQRDAPLAVASSVVSLPIRADAPTSQADADAQLAQARAALQAARTAGADLPTIKRLADRIETVGYFARGDQMQWTGLDFAAIASGRIAHTLFALRIGPAVIAGLPSEPVAAYSTRLRDALPRQHIITAEECNGYLSYIPTAADFPHGGYEVCAAITGPDADPVLHAAALALIAQVSTDTESA